MSRELHLMAIEVYNIYDDNEEAVEELVRRIGCNEDLQKVILRDAAQDALDYAKRSARQMIERGNVVFQPKVFTETFQKSVTYTLGKYLNWPLVNGVLLRCAILSDLDNSIEHYMQDARGNACKALFCRKIRDSLTSKKCSAVAEVYRGKEGNDALKLLYDSAEAEAAGLLARG